MTPTVHFFKIQKEKERRPIVPKPRSPKRSHSFFCPEYLCVFGRVRKDKVRQPSSSILTTIKTWLTLQNSRSSISSWLGLGWLVSSVTTSGGLVIPESKQWAFRAMGVFLQ